MSSNIMAERLGPRLQSERKRAGYSQVRLAADAKVERTWLQSVETGVSEDPSFLRMMRVADALAVDPHYLATGDPRYAGTQPIAVPPELVAEVNWFLGITNEARRWLRRTYDVARGQGVEAIESVDDQLETFVREEEPEAGGLAQRFINWRARRMGLLHPRDDAHGNRERDADEEARRE